MMKLQKNICNYRPLHNTFIDDGTLIKPSNLSCFLFNQRNIDVYGKSTTRYSLFSQLNYPYILRKKFDKKSKDKAYFFCESLFNRGQKVVITPYHNLSSISLVIDDINSFEKVWDTLIQKNLTVTVESCHSGDPFRVFCKGKKILAIYVMTPAFVVGDGYSTLLELIDDFRDHRSKNILYSKYPLKNINKGLDMTVIPIKGEIVQLKSSLQIQHGACYVDFTEELKDKYQELINAIDTISSLDDYIEITCFSENISAGVKEKTFIISDIKSKGSMSHLFVNMNENYFMKLKGFLSEREKIKDEKTFKYNKLDLYNNDHFLSVGQTDVLSEAAYQLGLKVSKLESQMLLVEDTKSKKRVSFLAGMSQYTSELARQITLNKQTTKNILDENGIRTPRGKLFNIKDVPDAVEYLSENTGMKFVVKPLNLQGGKGVSTDIIMEIQLRDAWKRCEALKSQQVIIEEQIDGDDYRVLVIENQVCAASRRVAPYVIGDGENSISQLVELKNISRKKNKYLGKHLIKINSYVEYYLSLQGYSIEDIPPKNTKVALSKVSNAGSGGDIVDCSDRIHKDWIPIAVKIRKLMADAYHVGIDFLMEDISKSPQDQKWGVIEVNTNPDFAVHLFPSEGQSRNIGKFFLEKMFSPVQQDKSAYKLKILGKVQKVGYRRWFKLICEFRSVYGYVKNDSNKNIVEAVIFGYENNLEDIVELCYKGPKDADVNQVIVEELGNNFESYVTLKSLEIR